MNEEFLHYIWKFKKFSLDKLITTTGNPLQILDFGQHNHNAGPDFMNACVKISGQLWFGNVEIHLNSLDWVRHKHSADPAYNNIILHVVYEDTGDVFTHSGNRLPCLELKGRIDEKIVDNYRQVFRLGREIPCGASLHNVQRDWVSIYLETLLVRRLERKHGAILSLLEEKKMDWEQTCYHLLFRYLGGKVNRDAFGDLARRIPHRLLIKYNNHLILMEALIIGQSGLLDVLEKDNYFQKLETDYLHLKKKHNLTPMTGYEWKFSKMRPDGFPVLRMAQVAAIYNRNQLLFRTLVTHCSSKSMEDCISTPASNYWDTHYIPGRVSKYKIKKPGKHARTVVVLNAFIPLIFAYGRLLKNEALCEKAVDMLGNYSAENNAILRIWKKLGITALNSGESQALIELKTEYCDKFKCLQCAIGTKLLLNEK